MNWNTKPESFAVPTLYSKSQSSFLEQQNLLNTTSQGSLNSPGSNQPACMFISNPNPVLQPLLNIRNYNTPQQSSVPNMHSGTTVASQTSADKITYANMKGPKQLNHSLQMSSGVAQNVWLNSPVRNSMFSHSGASVSQQTGLRTNTANVNALQNQSVTLVGDTYSMQVQMIPSNSVRVPITYQGNQRLNSSLSERHGDWTQQYTSSELSYPDYRPLPKQNSYSSQSFFQNPNLQKQNSLPPTSLQVKNSHPSNSALTLQSKQTETVQSYPYAVTRTDRRPPPPYDCRYASQPLQNTQHVIKHSSVDIPHSQETHLPEMRQDFYRNFQQQNLYGNFRNFNVSTNSIQPFNDPIISAGNNQEERGDSCNVTSNQVLDTSATKERLARDIKTLIEIKKKFAEVARKIKINKNVLMAVGCIKTTKDSSSESFQNSEVPVKPPDKMQSGPQVTLVTPDTANDKPQTVMGTVEERSRTHSTLNSNIQDTNCRNFSQVNSILLNSVCSEKVSVPDQLNDLKVTTSLKNSALEDTHATLNNTQLSLGNLVHIEENISANSEATLNKNKLLLSLLLPGDKNEKMLLKDACEITQDSKPQSFETNSNTQITGNKLNMTAMETLSTSNRNAKISDNSFCLEQKSSTSVRTLNDSHCPMELLATCLSLWTEKPSEPTIKQCNESASRTAAGISNRMESSDKSPVSAAESSQNEKINCSQVTTTHMTGQNYEASSVITTKATELQIAVVSPLILSDVKTLPVKQMKSEALPETVYPVIKEGSVCSLQNQLAEDASATSAMKVNESVLSTSANSKIFPIIWKEKQDESLASNSEGTPNTSKGKPTESEADLQYPVCGQQSFSNVRDGDVVSSDLLQIDNICSLVEGDTSYNSHIAEIFSSPPVTEVESQKSSLPSLQMIDSRQQKEQLDNITESKDSGFQKHNIQSRDSSHKISDQSKSLQPPESSFLKTVDANSKILEESILEHITKKESTAKGGCPAAIQLDSSPQETAVSYNSTAWDPVRNEIPDDETSELYPHDQLSELLKEFPYGIKAVSIHEGSVAQQITEQMSKDQSCDKTSCDSKDSTDQIKITILNSEQMKELFPEQNDQLCAVEELKKPEKENPVTKEESQCDPPVCADGASNNSLVDLEKDDIHCCAVGWLCSVYEGIPQCQCDSIENLTPKVEEKEQCSLETDSCKQEECTSDRDVPMDLNSPPNDNLKIALPFPDGKNHFPEIGQGKSIKEMSKTKNSSLRTERKLSDQNLTKGDKTLGSLQSHKKKRSLKFHEVAFHSNEMKISQESLQRRLTAQNSNPLQAKSGFLTNKFKDPHMKNDSSVRSVLPEKRKLKAGNSEQKVSEKRKLDQGSMLDSEIKRMKYDKQEQNKNGGSTLKIRNILSSLDERSKFREKTVSNVKSSGSKDSSFKINRPLSQECLQRQKHKEAKGIKASRKNSRKNMPCDSQYMRSSKLSVHARSYGKSSERHSSSVQTSKESLNICSSQDKDLRAHHPEGSKASGNMKEVVGGKQHDKMWIDKTKLHRNLNKNNEGGLNQMSPKVMEQRKQYLNRVAFKCTERQSIFLTKLENLPKKFNKEKILEDKHKSLLLKKDTTGQQSMLQFKLCPDGLMNKSTDSVKEQKDLQSCPQKEQAPLQVTGIKSTKEDWIKGTPEEKRTPEASQEIGVCNLDPLGQFLCLDSNSCGSLPCAKNDTVPDIAVGRKRGLDQLFSACDTNGPFITSPSSASLASGNDSKKVKGEDRRAGTLSRGIRIQKLPKDVTEGKVISLGLPLGKVTDLMNERKKQAFIDTNMEEATSTKVKHTATMTPVLHSWPINVQFSNHKELKTDNSPNQVQAQATLKEPNSVESGNLVLPASTPVENASMAVAGQGPVLRIIMKHLFYPVTLDILHQIFSKFGTVLKIITFTKNNQFLVLLQYATAVSARQAKLSLDGQKNIHNICCTLRITFSKITNLKVEYNNSKSRDYAHPNLLSGDSQSSLHQTMTADLSVPGIKSASSYAEAGFPPTFAIPQAAGLSVPSVHGALASPAILSEAAAAAGQITVPGLAGAENSVLLVSNLNPERVTLQCLFILFGVYGNVQRVKIFFNKEKALVQMADGSQAQLAMSHLNGHKLHGMPVHVILSSHQNVRLPQLGQKKLGLALDYRNSPLHRFKTSCPKSFQNIFPPSATLYLRNIPPYVSEIDLTILFSSNDRIVKRLKFFQKGRRVACIRMGSVEEAIEALTDMHNYRLGKKHYLYVTFSKFAI